MAFVPFPARSPSRRALLATLLVAPAPLAQTPHDLPVGQGFIAHTRWIEVASPFGLVGVVPGGPAGDLFFAVDNLVYRLDPQDVPAVVHALAAGDRVGFLARAGSALMFADATHDRLHVRDLGSGGHAVVPIPRNSFDAAITSGGRLVVSANPGWPAPGAETGIWLVDPAGAAPHREIVALNGPSGPVAVDPRSGDLLYATQSGVYPPPPGSTSILRFPATAVATAIGGGATLTTSDARVFAANLDGAYDLEFDERGCLYVSDPQRGGVIRFLPDGRRDPTPVVAPGREKVTSLAFVDRGPGTFDPYQPTDGGSLLMVTADWISLATVREIRPARPRLSTPFGAIAPPGPVRLVAEGLPPGEPALLMASSLPALPAEHALLSVSGVPVWTALDLQVPVLTAWTNADAAGRVQLDFTHPGGLGFSLTLAALGTTDPGRGDLLVATTPTTPLTLLP